MILPPSTARIAFAKITASDLEDLFLLDSDPAVMQHITGGTPSTRDDFLKPGGYLERMCSFSKTPQGYFSARVDGEFVGWFHLRPSVFDAGQPELGYRLGRAHWGQGLATEGSIALCKWAFQELGAPTVDACAMATNQASIGVLRKCGMRLLGSQSHPWVDILVERYQVSRQQFFITVPHPR